MKMQIGHIFNTQSDERGTLLLSALIFGAIGFSIIASGIIGYAVMENKAAVIKQEQESAFQIAEAGVNYYRWHLAHAKDDYMDGTNSPGPYIHEFANKDGVVTGYYSLNIIPPPYGSSIVTIESTGWTIKRPDSRRTVRVKVGFPALTDYAFLTNSDAWVGDSETVHGKFHANSGIRFDGVGDANISSAAPTYTCKSHQGCGNVTKPGIWGSGGPTDYWQFPVPYQDFSAITAKLADMKTSAINGGIYLPSSGSQGWRLVFKTDGQVEVSKVETTDCYKGQDINSNKYEWFCLDAKTFGPITVYDLPSNGFVYVEDMVWVSGTVNGRVTVGTATGKSIIIHDNLTYLSKDGTHVLGLASEKNILIPHNSPNVLEINAAVMAQNGSAKRYYYPGDKKDRLIIYGSIISGGTWTWSWVSGGGVTVSGYDLVESTYDANLTYGPPPGFPVGQEYNVISWEEVK